MRESAEVHNIPEQPVSMQPCKLFALCLCSYGHVVYTLSVFRHEARKSVIRSVIGRLYVAQQSIHNASAATLLVSPYQSINTHVCKCHAPTN